MEFVICKYDQKNGLLSFAGANIPIWLVEENIEEPELVESSNKIKQINTATNYYIKEIKADNQPIGYIHNRTPFTNHVIPYKKGTMLYIFSDGYADQFGGPNGKKFKYSRVRNLLLEIHEFGVDNQKQLIKEAFISWKGDAEQVDDVCVMGLRL